MKMVPFPYYQKSLLIGIEEFLYIIELNHSLVSRKKVWLMMSPVSPKVKL